MGNLLLAGGINTSFGFLLPWSNIVTSNFFTKSEWDTDETQPEDNT